MTIKKIFVTGATGFIGRHLVRRLISEGYDVGALVRSASSSKPAGTTDGVSYFTGDIRNYDDLSSAVSAFRPDAIIHLVTYYAVMHRADEIGVMTDTNVRGTINLLEAAKETGGVRLFVNTSSCAVYEEKKHRLREDDTIRPQNMYALTKIQAEEACSYYAGTFHLPCVTLRVFPPFGPGDHERRLIPYVIESILKNTPPNLTTGKQEWDFVYVDDIVNAYVAVLKSYPFRNDHAIFNIGTGNPVSIRSVVEKIRENIGSDINLPWGSVAHRPNEVWYNSADITKAKDELHWTPQRGLDEGIRMTVAWFRDFFQQKDLR
ncbi:MAG: NAD-dependent epimerase/dehydratase family protein [Methanoregula sp.]|jgi:nucleoside-diphosphate-sugar epimerase|uniref:NAD-dependent epimerase/dehydratase family protein n=1 Tax=Methanoregula sp. TaxID=2052170 RepID=UPI0025E6BF7E|nr:NAD-dependent epimerase/dehydratase family protein [Methanoregula sp.]MCK9630268.1 NAD-dependent epimerase/dehydratase family protein [Methanoregula sp.]